MKIIDTESFCFELIKRVFNASFFFCLILLSFSYNSSNAQEPIWAKSVSGTDYEYGVDADIDSQGNVFIIGYGTGDSLKIDNITRASNGDGDAFIAKISANGQLLWFKTLGGNDNIYFDTALDIHVDDNGDVILLIKATGGNFTYNGVTLSGINSAGQYSGEGVIIKIDNNGNYLWHDDGSISSSFQAVTTDSNNNIYLTGWFSNTLTLDTMTLTNSTNGTTVDMFVAKYTPTGSILWAKNVGGTLHNSFAFGHNIEIDKPSGKIVIIGRFNSSVYFDSGVLSTTASYATFLASYDSIGTELWKKSIFSNNNSYCLGLDISPNGLIGVAGFNSLSSNPDGLVGFYSLNGNIQSEQTYISTDYCRLYNLEFNHLNACYITGNFRNSLTIGTFPNNHTITTSNPSAGLLLKLDSSKIPVWTMQRRTSFENKVSCKYNRTLFSCRVDNPFTYNFGANTINNNSGDAIFTEITDSICGVTFITDNQTACNSYTWIDNNTYTTNNTSSTYYIPKSIGSNCDTLISLDLTINKVSNDSISINQNTITSNNASASYQWLDCNNNYAIIQGETGKSFTPLTSGNYAVELTENGCIDTSSCNAFVIVGLRDNQFENTLSVYPNPSNGNFSINLPNLNKPFTFLVKDIYGRLIQHKKLIESQLLNIKLEVDSGVYFLIIEFEDKKATIRIVIE